MPGPRLSDSKDRRVGALRLDQLLVERGLAPSRERARALILAGLVKVEGAVAAKAGQRVAADAAVELTSPDHPYVGRGGLKLADALDGFGIVVRDRTALDIGASTGGFTDVLLRRSASRVVALDVGRGQLAWKLRTDPRVTIVEGVNARTLSRSHLPAACNVFDIVTIDVSFISIRHILPVVPALLAEGADVVALVKPQFEAGRAEIGRGGLVTDPDVHRRVVGEVSRAADVLGLETVGTRPSGITGAEGNQEFFLHLRGRPGGDAVRHPSGDEHA
jgi:23S rRNA (cytidine1920-2'-O)/16S rRNA (cytidine1409-2'-O)-methyltransferase